ncbi:MAG: hypothetical protein JO086_12105 [Acidimicrobiia bacterium]|nr:hypothetical protein [Acidimicrobiia bacterium]
MSLSPPSASPGATVLATVTHAPLNATITITFGGTPLVATTAGSASMGCGAPGAGGGSVGFVVPHVDPGRYLVCAVVAGAESACSSFEVPVAVLGANFLRGDAPLFSPTNPNSVLAFTGLGLLRLLLLSAVLILGGWWLQRRSARGGSRSGRRRHAG